MTYGAFLERRRLGTYYFRQTMVVEGRQVSRRFSLGTKDVKLARFLALQLKAHIAMADLPNVRKFEIEYDENNQLKRVSTRDDADADRLQKFMEHQARQKAVEHQQALELRRFEAEVRQQQREAEGGSDQFAELRERLERETAATAKPGSDTPHEVSAPGNDLKALQVKYLKKINVTPGVAYKYKNTSSRFIAYAATQGVTTLDGITREFVSDYHASLKDSGQPESTTKNYFTTLSHFWNRLVDIGATKEASPFTRQVMNVKTRPRQPFTVIELEKIFADSEIRARQQLYFILLLQLTSGARPNEICQLWTDDIVHAGRFHSIRITENPARQQTLKTPKSERTIYLHKLLVAAGFLDFLQSRKLGRIFDLSRPADKNWSTFVSEEFTAHLRRMLISTKTMYCLRHTANNRLKAKLVKSEIRSDLLGQDGEGTNETEYSIRFVESTLKRLTEKHLSFEEVGALHAGALVYKRL